MKVTSAVRELVADFMQNPKKYPKLRIYEHPKYGNIMGSLAFPRGAVPPHLEKYLIKKGELAGKTGWYQLPDGTWVTGPAYELWKKYHTK